MYDTWSNLPLVIRYMIYTTYISSSNQHLHTSNTISKLFALIKNLNIKVLVLYLLERTHRLVDLPPSQTQQ